MRKMLLIAGLVVCLAAPALAAEESSHQKAAVKLLEIMRTQRMIDQMMTGLDGMMKQQFASMDLPPEGRRAAEEMREEIMDWFSEFFVWEEMRGMYVEIYTEVFTEAEINELIDFYQSPLGRKMIDKMPELMQKSMQKTQMMMQRKMPEFQKRMRKKMEELKERYKT